MLQEAPVSMRKSPARDNISEVEERAAEVVFMIYRQWPRFLEADLARSRGPGSAEPPSQTADDSKSSQAGGVQKSGCGHDWSEKLTAWRP